MEIRPDYYDDKSCKRFIQNMIDAGLGEHLRHYHGRFFWEGPAVVVDSLQDALSETKVKCQWDNMGLGYVVYPSNKCKLNKVGQEAQNADFQKVYE